MSPLSLWKTTRIARFAGGVHGGVGVDVDISKPKLLNTPRLLEPASLLGKQSPRVWLCNYLTMFNYYK
jgi:hypothetical protein